ncbi:MAG: CDP-alcohol phosphatidyltransferase family protein [Anaerolineae bacterium]|nr:CDP-alcohol phosphatidyltransferase family protein [Anaerolineae bacterium]
MAKVPSEYKFTDLSDYARPMGDWIARAAVATPLTPVHITIIFTVVGALAAALYLTGAYPAQVIAGLLLVLKSGIDAADGSLARLRGRPSRIGRFLDSIADFFINVAVLFAIAMAEHQRVGDPAAIWMAALALISVTWQGTIFNYFYVSYRLATQGDSTSQLNEAEAENYPWDNPATVRRLLAIYTLIYAWQDKLALYVDRRLLKSDPNVLVSRRFMTLASLMGLGMQLLIICLFSLIGQPYWSLLVFVIPFNLYWIALLLIRRSLSVVGL